MQGRRLTLRERCFLILEEPASGATAYALSLFLRAAIALAAAVATAESIEWLTERTGPEIWSWSAVAFNAIFTVEAIARIVCYLPHCAAAAKDPFIWLDGLSVLPLWVQLAVLAAQGASTAELRGAELRVLVSLGSCRLLKLCRYYDGVRGRPWNATRSYRKRWLGT